MDAVIVEYYVAASVVTGLAYAYDKAAAKRSWVRIHETFLLLLGLAGGWPGAVLTQQLLRHKTRKIAFQVWFWLSVLVNLMALAGLFYLTR